MLKKSEQREAAQRSYHRALEFLERMDTLKNAPEQLEYQYSQLNELSNEISASIKDLEQTAQQVCVTSSKKDAETLHKKQKGNKKKK